MNIKDILLLVQVIVGVILTATILLQARGASLGETFGGSGVFYGTRRGPERVLYFTTVVLAIVFVGLAFVALFV